MKDRFTVSDGMRMAAGFLIFAFICVVFSWAVYGFATDYFQSLK